MEKLKVELLKTLEDLDEEEFKKFKWHLKVQSHIPKARLVKAETQDTVDLMIQKYQGPEAGKEALKILEEIQRNDLVEKLKNALKDGVQKEKEKAKLKKLQKFAVDVTLDPDTAHPALFLTEDGKQVHDGDMYENLPDNPKRFNRCVNVLGKQSFSSGRFYYEVQVKDKTAWTLGVAKESIERKGDVTSSPKNGCWTIMLRDGDEYKANADDDPVSLSLNHDPQKVGVFVDHDKGLVSFYDADTADLLYSFTGCSFTEKLLPFFSPSTSDRGINSAPLIISPVKHLHDSGAHTPILHIVFLFFCLLPLCSFISSIQVFQDISSVNQPVNRERHNLNPAPLLITSVSHPLNLKTHDFGVQKEKYERKKAELMWVQQYAVEVTLNPDTAHPNLILSNDGRQVYHGDVRKKLPYNPKRFETRVNVLGKQGFSSGRFYFEVQVKGKTAWTVGVASESINTKEDIILTPVNGFWTMWLRNKVEYRALEDVSKRLRVKSAPQKVGVFVDYEEGLVSFYDVNTADLLYSFTGCSFTEKLLPYFSPCTNDGGINSAPLIISPVNHPLNVEKYDFDDQKEYEKKKADLMRVQQFAVEVTLDPDTAHPALFLSDDGKQVHAGDEYKNLPDNPKRFKRCVNVLGKQSFSSGRFYFEVQVKGKTAWDVGVARGSINRREHIILNPAKGFWTIWLRNRDEYQALEDPPVPLLLKSQPVKVGVFVDYDEGLVSFYDVNTADLLYSFTGCSLTDNLFPYFSPSPNYDGINSAPLIISPLSRSLNLKTHEQEEEYEKRKAELMRVRQFAVEVTLDPDTAHPELILSSDGKQVHHGNVKMNLTDNPKRFQRCVNVLGKESFSSGRFYFEVQVKGKTDWYVGVASESINRRENIKLSPQNGFWTIWLRNKVEYKALEDQSKPLRVKSQLEKVGVFVDYKAGLVSFYDVNTADLLYSFTGYSFTEKLLPYFSPSKSNGGINSAPLIISPVNRNK